MKLRWFLSLDFFVMVFCFMGAVGGICLMNGKKTLGFILLSPIVLFYVVFAVMMLIGRKRR